VEAVDHRRGRFLAAFKDLASEENERVSIVIANGAERLRVTLVAGLIARRIVCKVQPGQPIEAGQRIGLIQFGSRVDVALPDRAEIVVRLGQRVVAGETVIARLEPARRISDILAG
jgi:phosphatidylserine decarboxylase